MNEEFEFDHLLDDMGWTQEEIAVMTRISARQRADWLTALGKLEEM